MKKKEIKQIIKDRIKQSGWQGGKLKDKNIDDFLEDIENYYKTPTTSARCKLEITNCDN